MNEPNQTHGPLRPHRWLLVLLLRGWRNRRGNQAEDRGVPGGYAEHSEGPLPHDMGTAEPDAEAKLMAMRRAGW